MQGGFDSTGVHIEGVRAVTGDLTVFGFCATLPENLPAGGMSHLSAKSARYVPPDGSPRSGGWEMFDVTPRAGLESRPTCSN